METPPTLIKSSCAVLGPVTVETRFFVNLGHTYQLWASLPASLTPTIYANTRCIIDRANYDVYNRDCKLVCNASLYYRAWQKFRDDCAHNQMILDAERLDRKFPGLINQEMMRTMLTPIPVEQPPPVSLFCVRPGSPWLIFPE